MLAAASLIWALSAPLSLAIAVGAVGVVLLVAGAIVLIRPPALVRLDPDRIQVRGSGLAYADAVALEKIPTQIGPTLRIETDAGAAGDLVIPLRWLTEADRSALNSALTTRISAAKRAAAS